MSKDCNDLLEEAKNSPKNFAFKDLCALAECWGYEFSRQKSSHCIYVHKEFPNPPEKYQIMNFQPKKNKGQAKPYQVRQLLKAIDYFRGEHPDLV